MKKFAVCVVFLCSVAYAAESTETVPAGSVSTTTESSTETKSESKYGSLAGNLSLGSDYIFRGQTLTNHNPSANGEVDWTHPTGVYLGAWGSNVKFPDSAAKAEVDFYGGYNYAITSSLSAGLGLMYYSYYKASETNTLEYPLQITWNELKAGLAYAPHFGGADAASAWYASMGWSHKVKWETSLNLNVGYSMFAPELELNNYADFHAGLTRDMLGVTWDVSGYFVNAEQFNGLDDPRVVLAISKAL
jgi:uncharacterized protein (TIGR02001 family)